MNTTPDGSSSPRPRRRPKKNAPGIATAAVILGIVALLTSPFLLVGVLAIVVGLLAIGKTGEPTGRPGRGMAIAGIVMGTSSLLAGVVLMLLVALPYMAAKKSAESANQLRRMHQGLVTFANSNKERYPGLTSKGTVLPNDLNLTGNSGDGDTVEARYWILMDKSFIPPEVAISPSETEPRSPWSTGPVTTDHYSFAMLSIAGDPDMPPPAGARASEWTQSMNTQAIVLSDRNTGSNATSAVQSFHTPPGSWRGIALWNDNHVSFSRTHIFETRYGHGSLNVGPAGAPTDNLFEAQNDADAFMIDRGD